ncbi:glutamate racemase [Candidatus Falkowbacteria bacterium]|nr:glutamate racemase [Candidatus Falkowbacteria bacterium]
MIGVFDSGVGGLTVVREIFKKLPDYKIIYFGDTARTPYGTKSKETIIKYAREDAKFLLDHGAKIIVIACNTASAVAADILRKESGVPVFEVIMPAVRAALSATKKGKIGVIGTRATVSSGVYETMIKKDNQGIQVISQPCPLLVPLVEEAWLNQPETKKIVRKYLQPLKNQQIDTLILGCTHYPVLKNIIKSRIGKKVVLVDSAEEVVRELKEFLAKNSGVEKSLGKDGSHKFYVSDLTPQVPKIAEKLLGRVVKMEKVEVG